MNLKKRKIFKRTSVKLGFKSEWLTVISFYGYKKRYNVAAWLCRCKCGKEMLRTAHEIKVGIPKSCGCYFPPNLSDLCKKHGLSRHPLRGVWTGMKQRCYNSNADSYHNYGDKGITVCDDWKEDFKKFYDWAIDHNWVKGLCIDRIDNKKGYYPENCRIITRSENTKKIFIDNPECFRGINNHGAILTDDKVREIRKRITLGEPSYIIAKEMKVSKTTICQVKYYKRWKHVL